MFTNLDVRPGFEQEDIAAGRAALDAACANAQLTVVVTRKASSDKVAGFVKTATGTLNFRGGFWVTDDRIFDAGQQTRWFADDTNVVAVLDFNTAERDCYKRFASGVQEYEIDDAILEIEAMGIDGAEGKGWDE